MKGVLVVLGILAALMVCIGAYMLAGQAATAAVMDSLDKQSDDGATASNGQKATAVCVGLFNYRNCNITQESAATASGNPSGSASDGAVMGLVMFAMVFTVAAVIGVGIVAFLSPGDL